MWTGVSTYFGPFSEFFSQWIHTEKPFLIATYFHFSSVLLKSSDCAVPSSVPPVASTACPCWHDAQTPLAIYKPAVMAAVSTRLWLCWRRAPILYSGANDRGPLVFCRQRDKQDIKHRAVGDTRFVAVRQCLTSGVLSLSCFLFSLWVFFHVLICFCTERVTSRQSKWVFSSGCIFLWEIYIIRELLCTLD